MAELMPHILFLIITNVELNDWIVSLLVHYPIINAAGASSRHFR